MFPIVDVTPYRLSDLIASRPPLTEPPTPQQSASAQSNNQPPRPESFSHLYRAM